jgi:hypothetical protein
MNRGYVPQIGSVWFDRATEHEKTRPRLETHLTSFILDYGQYESLYDRERLWRISWGLQVYEKDGVGVVGDVWLETLRFVASEFRGMISH